MTLEKLTNLGFIVAADDELDCVVLWDGVSKFELYKRINPKHYNGQGWKCCDWFSCGVCCDVKVARMRAKEYLADISIRYRWARVA